ncbi:MAG: hypothetical protein JXL80_00635 [Planctomycetes bacterium]|nr:hypothetical protein [Planctomycetota bacterium]
MKLIIWKVLVVLGLALLVILTAATTEEMVKQYKKDNAEARQFCSGSPGVVYAPVNYTAMWRGCINTAALWAGGILVGVVLKPRAACAAKEL